MAERSISRLWERDLALRDTSSSKEGEQIWERYREIWGRAMQLYIFIRRRTIIGERLVQNSSSYEGSEKYGREI